MPLDEAGEAIKNAIEHTYSNSGDDVVRRNLAAVDSAVTQLQRVEVPEHATAVPPRQPRIAEDAPDFVKRVTSVMLTNQGDLLPVSAFPVDGTWPCGDVALGEAEHGPRDLGLEAMVHEHVYVARLALGAKDTQTVKTFIEADSYPGPSLIIAYCPCIAHGCDLVHAAEHQKQAVDVGYWPLYRFDPCRREAGLNPMQLDSKAPARGTWRHTCERKDDFRSSSGSIPIASARSWRQPSVRRVPAHGPPISPPPNAITRRGSVLNAKRQGWHTQMNTRTPGDRAVLQK